MAVTITGQVKHTSFSQRQGRTFIQYALSGTYATGGFSTPFLGVPGNLGSNAISNKNPLAFSWQSPLGYIYVSTVTMTAGIPSVNTKIFSAPNTELANGTAVPDASILCIVDTLRY